MLYFTPVQCSAVRCGAVQGFSNSQQIRMRFLLSNSKSSNRAKWHGIHLNLINIIVLLLFSSINIFVFKYNLHEDISSDV